MVDKITWRELVPSDIEYSVSDDEYLVTAIAKYLNLFKNSPYWKKYLEEKYGSSKEDDDNSEL